MQNFFSIDAARAGVITDAPPVSSILLHVLDFLLSIVGVLGIIGLVVAGVLYMTSAGNEERMRTAKNAALGSVIGVAIALGALILTGAIASFFS